MLSLVLVFLLCEIIGNFLVIFFIFFLQFIKNE